MRYPNWKILLLAVSIVMALPAQEARKNLALGKPYSVTPSPNYPRCMDPGDATQLTDGEVAKGTMWAQKGTVGWTNASPVFITLDLGRVQAIGGLSYSTAAGVADVGFSSSIAVLVSEDGKTWDWVGDLVDLGQRQRRIPMPGTYQTFCFLTEELATRGRYVQLVVFPVGPYTFVDEIQVFPGPKSLLTRPQSPGRIEDVRAYLPGFRARMGLQRRLNQDLRAVRTFVRQAKLGESSRQSISKKLERAERDMAPSPSLGPKGQPNGRLSTAFPINETHQKIFAAQAAAWRGDTPGQLVAWQKNRWDPLSPNDPPLGGHPVIEVAMMRGEFRSEAFNLTNTTTKPMELALRFEGLPGGALPGYLQVHAVRFTDTQTGVPVAAALPLAERVGQASGPGGGPYARITLLPGLTQQVWLTFRPSSLVAGEYVGRVQLRSLTGTGAPMHLPLKLKVYPFTFPAQPYLHLGGWDYSDREVNDQVGPVNRGAFIQHLRDHFVDSPWAQTTVLPTGRFDSEGRMIGEPDTRAFDTWVRRWPDARRYFVFINAGAQFSGLSLGTPAFDKAVGAWMTWWAQQLTRWRIQPRQLGLLLVDEPRDPGMDRLVVAWAKAIRAARSGVEIWEDPAWSNPAKANPEVFELSDALCPHLPTWQDLGKPFATFYQSQRQAGKRLWLYSAKGPGRLLDPYSYHRLQPWFCWKFGAVGAMYWSFGDSNGASGWNEYLATSGGAYTPLFLDGKTVTAGKHMEAIREGVEDVEYLRMLRDRIAVVEKEGRRGPALVAAKQLLATAADQVTSCMTSSAMGMWREPKDRSTADRVRIQILDALMSLR